MNSASTGASQPSASASQPSATSAVPPDGSGAPQSAARTKGRELIDAVKTLGYFPKETKSVGPEEKTLAKNIRRCQFTPAEQTEIDGLRRTSVHPRDRDRSAQLLEEAQEPQIQWKALQMRPRTDWIRICCSSPAAIAPEICSDASRSASSCPKAGERSTWNQWDALQRINRGQ